MLRSPHPGSSHRCSSSCRLPTVAAALGATLALLQLLLLHRQGSMVRQHLRSCCHHRSHRPSSQCLSSHRPSSCRLQPKGCPRCSLGALGLLPCREVSRSQLCPSTHHSRRASNRQGVMHCTSLPPSSTNGNSGRASKLRQLPHQQERLLPPPPTRIPTLASILEGGPAMMRHPHPASSHLQTMPHALCLLGSAAAAACQTRQLRCAIRGSTVRPSAPAPVLCHLHSRFQLCQHPPQHQRGHKLTRCMH